jgi:hypothetical protein
VHEVGPPSAWHDAAAGVTRPYNPQQQRNTVLSLIGLRKNK